MNRMYNITHCTGKVVLLQDEPQKNKRSYSKDY